MDGRYYIQGTGSFGINTSGEKSSTSETLMAVRGCRSAGAPPNPPAPAGDVPDATSPVSIRCQGVEVCRLVGWLSIRIHAVSQFLSAALQIHDARPARNTATAAAAAGLHAGVRTSSSTPP